MLIPKSGSPRPHALLLLAGLVTLALAGCGDDDPVSPTAQPTVIPAPDSPTALLDALEAIYNTQDHTAAERSQAYRALFPEDDHLTLPRFNFRPLPTGDLPNAWGRETETRVHEKIFAAQENGTIYALSLTLTASEPVEVTAGDGDNWQFVEVTDVRLRLLFHPDDGLEVDGGGAEFLISPADGRWYINDWTEVAPEGLTVEATTWGGIKGQYR